MGDRARVLWLTKGLGRGGTERLLVGTARFLDRQRWDVEVAYLIPAKNAYVPSLEDLDVPVHCLRGPNPWSVGWVPRLRRLISHGEFDLIHTHMPSPAVVARLVVKGPHPALVHTEHNLWQRYRRTTYWANAATYRRNAAVIAVSHGVERSIRQAHVPGSAPFPPVEVIIHGVDAEFFRLRAEKHATRDRIGIERDAPLIGSVANFTHKKDHHTLLEAMAQVAWHVPGVRLVLVGSGPLEDELRQHVARLGLWRTVRFLGSRDDVADILAMLDLFVLSSRHEGLSIALLEAFASGVPAVATRVGGIPEVIEDGRQGLLVHPGNPTALAAAIRSLLRDDARRTTMGAAAIERARAFDLASAVRQLEAVYEKVLAR
jgi:glycosyltransferase involved in cell wall biosynthesis